MITTLAVDLGGVVARFCPDARLAAMAERTQLTTSDVHQRIFGSGLDAAMETGAYGAAESIAAILDVLECRITHAELVDAWSLAFEPDAEVLETLATRTERLVLATNNGPMIDHCLARPLDTVALRFSDLAASWHVRAVKTDVAYFSRTENRLAINGTTALLLDDSQANIDTARRAGWRAERATCAAEIRAVFRHI